MAKKILGITHYTLTDVARMLEVANQTLTKYIVRGDLKVVKIGKRKYCTEKEIREFLHMDEGEGEFPSSEKQ